MFLNVCVLCSFTQFLSTFSVSEEFEKNQKVGENQCKGVIKGFIKRVARSPVSTMDSTKFSIHAYIIFAYLARQHEKYIIERT